jgi:membrane protein implicated in regulation of membrane protease activity
LAISTRAGQSASHSTKEIADSAESSVYASAVDDWIVWLIVASVLGVVEVLTLTFVLGMLATGAAAAAVVAAVGGSAVWQYLTFAAVSAILLLAVLPAARRHRFMPPSIRTGTASLVGHRALTLSDINTADGGQVRIGGETWTARPYDAGQFITAGQWVDVVAIDGATAVVQYLQPGPGADIGVTQ